MALATDLGPAATAARRLLGQKDGKNPFDRLENPEAHEDFNEAVKRGLKAQKNFERMGRHFRRANRRGNYAEAGAILRQVESIAEAMGEKNIVSRLNSPPGIREAGSIEDAITTGTDKARGQDFQNDSILEDAKSKEEKSDDDPLSGNRRAVAREKFAENLKQGILERRGELSDEEMSNVVSNAEKLGISEDEVNSFIFGSKEIGNSLELLRNSKTIENNEDAKATEQERQGRVNELPDPLRDLISDLPEDQKNHNLNLAKSGRSERFIANSVVFDETANDILSQAEKLFNKTEGGSVNVRTEEEAKDLSEGKASSRERDQSNIEYDPIKSSFENRREEEIENIKEEKSSESSEILKQGKDQLEKLKENRKKREPKKKARETRQSKRKEIVSKNRRENKEKERRERFMRDNPFRSGF